MKLVWSRLSRRTQYPHPIEITLESASDQSDESEKNEDFDAYAVKIDKVANTIQNRIIPVRITTKKRTRLK